MRLGRNSHFFMTSAPALDAGEQAIGDVDEFYNFSFYRYFLLTFQIISVPIGDGGNPSPSGEAKICE
ncbi:MAG: hypothetical protein ACP5Q3_16925, partial [bacterium]